MSFDFYHTVSNLYGFYNIVNILEMVYIKSYFICYLQLWDNKYLRISLPLSYSTPIQTTNLADKITYFNLHLIQDLNL